LANLGLKRSFFPLNIHFKKKLSTPTKTALSFYLSTPFDFSLIFLNPLFMCCLEGGGKFFFSAVFLAGCIDFCSCCFVGGGCLLRWLVSVSNYGDDWRQLPAIGGANRCFFFFWGGIFFFLSLKERYKIDL
jgi:hypothetical protein